MSTNVYKSVAELKGLSVKNCVPMPEPTRLIMCPPEHYEARDERNPFSSGHVSRVNRHLARKQWQGVYDTLTAYGLKAELLPFEEGLADMVFCANQAFAGLTPKLERVCLMGSVRYASRRREMAAFETWFREAGYRVVELKDKDVTFGGSGDAVWHPGRRLIWGGFGFCSDVAAYDYAARTFSSPAVVLKLVNERFPNLTSCFCPLTQEAVLIYPSAFDAASLEIIFRMFPVIITASEPEAVRQMACNAVVVGGKTAIVQRGAVNVARHVAALGLEVVEVDASEFIKGGGGACALKMSVY